MDEKKKKINYQVIERVEDFLQTEYSENEEFNLSFNGDEPVKVKSLKEPSEEYEYEISEVLFWVDRNAYNDELEFWRGEKVKSTHHETIKYLKETDQIATFSSLIEIMKKGRIAPFIGAGLSIPCGYPLWGKALEKIALKLGGRNVPDIKKHIKRYDYIQAAQALFDSSSVQVENFIRTEYALKSGSDGQPAIIGPVQLLPQITHGCIVTTNFDEVIEQVFKREGEALDGYMHGMQTGNNFVQRLLSGSHCILKLHGNSLDRSSYVFTRDQYVKAYGNPLDFRKQLPRALRQIYVGHSLLFLGCSLEQDKTLELFKNVKDENQFDIPEHFALLPIPDKSSVKIRKENRLLKLEIHPIWYPPDDKHSLVEKLLKLAISIMNKEIQLG